MGTVDFTNLPLASVVATLLFFAAIDTGATIILSIISGNFSGIYVVEYLRTHVLKIATPIFGLALVGHGIASVGIPAIPAAGLAASVSLLAYAVATIASLKSSFEDKGAVPNVPPAPPFPSTTVVVSGPTGPFTPTAPPQ